MLIHKEFYGLRSSAVGWYEKLTDNLQDMIYVSCKTEPNIWIRDKKQLAVYLKG